MILLYTGFPLGQFSDIGQGPQGQFHLSKLHDFSGFRFGKQQQSTVVGLRWEPNGFC
jgi:hypothetical protein